MPALFSPTTLPPSLIGGNVALKCKHHHLLTKHTSPLVLTCLSLVFSIPLSIWAEHNGTAFHFVSTYMCGRLDFNVPHSGPLVVWATTAFHGTTAQSVVRFATQDATVTFKQALTCRKISVILNGGLRQEGHTTQVRDTTSSGTREASSTKSRRRPVGR